MRCRLARYLIPRELQSHLPVVIDQKFHIKIFEALQNILLIFNTGASDPICLLVSFMRLVSRLLRQPFQFPRSFSLYLIHSQRESILTLSGLAILRVQQNHISLLSYLCHVFHYGRQAFYCRSDLKSSDLIKPVMYLT